MLPDMATLLIEFPKAIMAPVFASPTNKEVTEMVPPEENGIIAPGPVGPVSPVGPVGPVTVLAAPVGPVGPVSPVGPVTVLATPIGPVGPVYPIGPVGPVAPVGPVEPVAPIWSIQITRLQQRQTMTGLFEYVQYFEMPFAVRHLITFL